jgi:hypothetical protein
MIVRVARVVNDLSDHEARRVLSDTVDQSAHLMSDEWKSFVSVGEAFSAHDTVRHSERPRPCKLGRGVQ